MEPGEVRNFIGVWSTATISGIYCYAVSKSTKSGPLRHFLLLPVVAFFTALPLTLSTFHLGGVTFFSLTWLANFKLLLLSFDTGPLAGPPAASSPILHFLCTLLLPVKLSDGPSRSGPSRAVRRAKAVAFGAKVVCFGLLVVPYSYKEEMSEMVLVALHCIHTYLLLEISLALIGALTRAALGLKLDLEVVVQFDEPYLSSSLQDFWGRRWNLIASDILKQTIHTRIRNHRSRSIGKTFAMFTGVLISFLASGLMHELGYYYITRVHSNGKIMLFFMFHGVCMNIEIIIKKMVPAKWHLHRAISIPLTIGFYASSAVWLLFPSLLRNRIYEKGYHEYLAMEDYVKSVWCSCSMWNYEHNVATSIRESIWG